MCTRLVKPPADASSGGAGTAKVKRNPRLTTHRMDQKPWETCTIADICAAEGKKPRCSWCKFKKGLKEQMADSTTKADAETLWAKYCSHCDDDAAKVSVRDACMLCNGCKTHFCSGECFREFHFPGIGD